MPPPTANARGGTRILVLGLGNDLLTDDAIGLRLTTALRERLKGEPGFSFQETSEMGLALLDLVTGYDRLVLVDAVQTGHAAPGFIHELDGANFPQIPSAAPHFLGIGETLALGRELGIPLPGIFTVFAIEVKDPFTLGTHLTAALETALNGIADDLARRLLNLNRVLES